MVIGDKKVEKRLKGAKPRVELEGRDAKGLGGGAERFVCQVVLGER